MPADLDEFFGALGSYTDSAPVSPPERARRRGRQRTRRHLAATALAVMLVIGSVVVGTTRFQQHDPPPPTPATPAPPVRFTPLQPLGAGVDMDLGGGYGMTAVVGDRAYVGARTGGRLQVNAIDLKTGNALWSTVDLGSFGDWNGLLAGPQAVVMIGEHDDGTIPDHVLMVLDPDTGARRWQTGFDELDLEWYDTGAVLPSRGSVRAVDWRTGAELWRTPVPGTDPEPAFMQNFPTADATTAPAMMRIGLDPTDHRLFMIEPSGQLHRYDATTGREEQVVPNVGPPDGVGPGRIGYYYTIVDDQVFSFDEDATHAYRYDLRNPAGVVPVYTAADQHRIRSVTACGPGRACVMTQQLGGQPNTLNLVDLASGRALWQADVGYADYAHAAGDWILTDRGNLFDAITGRRLDHPSTAFGGWVTPGSVLTFVPSTDDPEPAKPHTVFGISTVEDSPMSLGQVGPIAGLCGWSTTVLVCPTTQGFRAWRFAT